MYPDVVPEITRGPMPSHGSVTGIFVVDVVVVVVVAVVVVVVAVSVIVVVVDGVGEVVLIVS